MAPLEDALATVSSIGIVLLGSLPMADWCAACWCAPLPGWESAWA